MKKDDVIILAATFLVGVMVIVFTIMLVFIGNHTDKLVSDTVQSSETSFVVEETAEGTGEGSSVSRDGTGADSRSEENQLAGDGDLSSQRKLEEIEKLILSEDEVDLVVEDTAIHDVEYESTYVNTIELVPSTKDEREQVPADEVSRENFTAGRLGEEKCVVTITTVNKEGLEEQVKVSVPTEVFLYNVDSPVSNSCEIQAAIEGEASMLRSIG